MRTYNIHEAKTHLSRLVDEAVQGEPFIIAKAGKPKVKVVRLDVPVKTSRRRLGMLKGKIRVPLDIKTPFAEEIEELFYGKP
jgi:prevent-host-death family protein